MREQKLVVVVCTANQCRSPMAEKLLARSLGKDSGWKVLSAGTAAFAGLPASRYSVEVMMEKGIDIGSHRSRLVTDGLVDKASLLLTMTASQRDEILDRFPEAAGKVFLITALGADQRHGDVADPVGMSADDYRRIRDEIDEALPDVVLFLHEYGKK